MSQLPVSRARPGRPAESDPEAIAAVALSLFEEKGYARVTMDDVATAARVSRRTLFRLFPSKAELAWAGLSEVTSLTEALAAALPKAHADVAGVLEKVLTPVLVRLGSPKAMRFARRRLRIIASSPELMQHASLDGVQQRLAVVLGRGRATSRSRLAARSIVAVGFGAMLWWAEHGGRMTPLEATREAFRALR